MEIKGGKDMARDNIIPEKIKYMRKEEIKKSQKKSCHITYFPVDRVGQNYCFNSAVKLNLQQIYTTYWFLQLDMQLDNSPIR